MIGYLDPQLHNIRDAVWLSFIWIVISYDNHVPELMVQVLERPPKSWWSAFEERGTAVTKVKEAGQYSLVDQVSEIGAEDEPPLRGEAPTRPCMEPPGTGPSSEEVCCLAGLLQRTLNYMPEKRLPIEGILRHKMVHWGFPNEIDDKRTVRNISQIDGMRAKWRHIQVWIYVMSNVLTMRRIFVP